MKLWYTAFCTVALAACAGDPKILQPSDLSGRWTVGDDTSIFLANGTYLHIKPGRVADTSIWQLKNGVLVLTPQPAGIEREYDILESGNNFFRYRCTNRIVDDSIYTARKAGGR